MLRGVVILLVVCVALQRVPVTQGNPPLVFDMLTTLRGEGGLTTHLL